MLGAVSSDTGPEPAARTPKPGRPAWWVRLISHVPMVLLDRLADLLGWLAFRVFPYREHVVRENLTKAFPDVDEAGIRKIMRAYYNGFAQMLVELLKGATMPAGVTTRRKPRLVNSGLRRYTNSPGVKSRNRSVT